YEYGDTALEGYFGEGTVVGGNDNTCANYALKQLTSSQLNESMIIVVINSARYAGTCWMYYPGSENKGYGSGLSIAYFPKGENPDVFAQLLHHEACGHGFAKLDDEYAYQAMGAVPSQEREDCIKRQTEWGWSKNIDFTSDLATIRWNRFISDERYANDGLGAFEGAMTYWTGVYRPTNNSIMRHNTDGFNAPSREAIYYRIHKLAYGDEWQYDYEEFVAWDAINRKKASSAYQEGGFVVESPILDPPVIVPYSWKEAFNME
ncbi:MAG: M64 family metallopeptidase, partial [Candidatus Cryptobacteroides sp.]